MFSIPLLPGPSLAQVLSPVTHSHNTLSLRSFLNVCDLLYCSVYTCLTQLYDGIDMYNLLHKEQLHVSALFIGHLHVDK